MKNQKNQIFKLNKNEQKKEISVCDRNYLSLHYRGAIGRH